MSSRRPASLSTGPRSGRSRGPSLAGVVGTVGNQAATLDEALGADGSAHPHCADLAARLEQVDLPSAGETIRASLAAQRVGFGGGDNPAPFLVDPVPRVVAAGEWELLRDALAQRGRALAEFVADVYGARAIVAA